MIKHPKLIEICREREIVLEVCPISFVLFLKFPVLSSTCVELCFYIETRFWCVLSGSLESHPWGS
jgi:adenosine deaminase